MPHAAARILREEHVALAAVPRSLLVLTGQGPGDQPKRFFDVLRAMLFYIDEFPERLHHPKESRLLFPKLSRADPALAAAVARLEAEHVTGQAQVRELQHLLLAWELIGEGRRGAFTEAAERYVEFYLEHMRCEETELLSVAESTLPAADWAELDKAFLLDKDPLASGTHDPCYDRLFTHIVLMSPAPIGVGPSLDKQVPE